MILIAATLALVTAPAPIADMTSYSAEEADLVSRAKECGDALSRIYPNHMWIVQWAPGGVLAIKHGLGDNRYGYTIDNAMLCSYADLVRACTLAGGELLERMGMRRGAWNGEDQPTSYEGAPL